MGFKRKKTVYLLTFEDPELEGLEVRAYGPPLGFFEQATRMGDLSGKRAEELTPEEMERVTGFFTDFAKHLVSWNLEEDQTEADGTIVTVPVPATVDGLRSQDFGFVMEIVGAWLEAVGEVSAPLPQPSSSGRPPLEGSLPMDPLSPSQPSSSGPSGSSAAVSDSDASRVS